MLGYLRLDTAYRRWLITPAAAYRSDRCHPQQLLTVAGCLTAINRPSLSPSNGMRDGEALLIKEGPP